MMQEPIQVHKSNWDGILLKSETLRMLEKIPESKFFAWSCMHTIEDSIPCDSCRKKHLTRGLHQVVNYQTKVHIGEIPKQYDNPMATLKKLTDESFERAQFHKRL